jgi:hypothetical protein
MKAFIVLLVVCTALMGLLFACNANQASTNVEKTGTPSATDDDSNSGKLVPNCVSELALIGSEAPNLDEIQAGLNRLAGEHLPVTRQQYDEMLCYTRGLEGKRVQDWQGWVRELSLESDERQTYAVYISVEDPSLSGGVVETPIILTHVDLDQVTQLKAWREPSSVYQEWEEAIFSGNIGLVTPSPKASVYLVGVSVKPK